MLVGRGKEEFCVGWMERMEGMEVGTQKAEVGTQRCIVPKRG